MMIFQYMVSGQSGVLGVAVHQIVVWVQRPELEPAQIPVLNMEAVIALTPIMIQKAVILAHAHAHNWKYQTQLVEHMRKM